MLHDKYVFRRCVWLLATVWCTAIPTQVLAGRPATAEENAAQAEAAAAAVGNPLPVASSTSGRLAANDLLAPTADLLARADQPAVNAPITSPATPSQNVTINLINRLVERGLLTKQDSQD